jgi:hypothetical protein
MDMLYWTQHAWPRTTPENWPAGKIASHVSVERCITGRRSNAKDDLDPAFSFGSYVPPSTRIKLDGLLRMTESDIFATKIPFVQTDLATVDALPLWSIALKYVDLDRPPPCTDAPVSTSTHEDEQLYYGREGVPLCSLGDQCAALFYSGNMGALHIYLDPSTQAAFDKDAASVTFANPHATCLLCIRNDVHALRLSCNAMLPNSGMQVMRQSVAPPPFCNLVDVPGGYKKSVMAVDTEPMFQCASICGVSGEINVNFDAHRNEKGAFFFDQSKLKCSPPHFLCQARKTPTL